MDGPGKRGTAVLIKDNVAFSETTIDLHDSSILALKLKLKHKDIQLIGIYRHPNTLSSIGALDSVLALLKKILLL